MQLSRILFAIFFTCLRYNAFCEGENGHDFHFSRLALDWNPKTNTWQGILRVFTDDLERSLSQAEGTEINWRLGDRREHEKADLVIENYVANHWMSRQGEAQDSAMQWHYVGKEIDFDLTYVYIETNEVESPLPLEITSSGFFELFDDQVNEITFNVHGESKREWLSAESPVVRITSMTR